MGAAIADFAGISSTGRKVNATGIVRLSATAGSRSARSAMLSVPVITYISPIPMTMKVAPVAPMMRYWYAAVSARRSWPSAIIEYAESDDTSRKTKTLKTSPVIEMPSSPVSDRMNAA